MITKKSIHEDFKKSDLKYTDNGCDGSDECCGCCGGDFLSESKVKHFYDTQIQKLFGEVIPKMNIKQEISGSGTFDNEGNDHYLNGFNQAISEIKQKIKEAGF